MAFADFISLMTPDVWVTSGHERLPVRLMETQHLENAVRFCLRWAKGEKLREELDAIGATSFFNGEGAQDACAAEAHRLCRMTEAEYCQERIPPFARMRQILEARRHDEHAVGEALGLGEDWAAEPAEALALIPA